MFTGRNEVVAKVMFLLVSVILFTGGLPQCMLGYHPPPGRRHPPGRRPFRRRHPPRKETPWHTANERLVRILMGMHSCSRSIHTVQQHLWQRQHFLAVTIGFQWSCSDSAVTAMVVTMALQVNGFRPYSMQLQQQQSKCRDMEWILN